MASIKSQHFVHFRTYMSYLLRVLFPILVRILCLLKVKLLDHFSKNYFGIRISLSGRGKTLSTNISKIQNVLDIYAQGKPRRCGWHIGRRHTNQAVISTQRSMSYTNMKVPQRLGHEPVLHHAAGCSALSRPYHACHHGHDGAVVRLTFK